uniref:Glycoprotein n=1 Tax=Hemipteran rhabdo-related virus OKIAV26 TaxID=2746290 RepID=A0A7D7IQD5_9RHAB|nr:glycoprotein [Hemipteran rhabdo-related virus OKIAV26]
MENLEKSMTKKMNPHQSFFTCLLILRITSTLYAHLIHDLISSETYFQLTTFPQSSPTEIIEPQYPLPCRPLPRDSGTIHAPTSGSILQLHPSAHAFGVVCICVKKTTVNKKTWVGVSYYDKITLNHGNCKDYPQLLQDVYKSKMEGDFYSALLPHQTQAFDPDISEENFPYFGSETATRPLYKCTKTTFSQNLHYQLIDPHPEQICNQVPCLINNHTLFYSNEFNKKNHQCLLFKLRDISGLLLRNPLLSNKTIIFSSDAHGRDLSFNTDPLQDPECISPNGDRVYISQEGVYMSFQIQKETGLDVLQWMMGKQRFRRSPIQSIPYDIESSQKFDIIPISQQNQWLFSRITTDEAGLLHLMHASVNHTIQDLLSIKHIQCMMKRRLDLMSYYIVEQFPMPYLKSIYPEHSFVLESRSPLTIRKGVRLLFRYSSLPSNLTLNSNNQLLIKLSGRECQVQNITGTVSCDDKKPNDVKLLNKSFLLPLVDGQSYDLNSDKRVHNGWSYTIQTNIFEQTFIPLEINYEQDSDYLREIESASLVYINTRTDQHTDSDWGKSVVEGIQQLFDFQKIMYIITTLLFGTIVLSIIMTCLKSGTQALATRIF